jgi:hypothetical protein
MQSHHHKNQASRKRADNGLLGVCEGHALVGFSGSVVGYHIAAAAFP